MDPDGLLPGNSLLLGQAQEKVGFFSSSQPPVPATALPGGTEPVPAVVVLSPPEPASKKARKERPPRPNYFVAVPLAHDPRVLEVIRAVHEHMELQDARLQDVLVEGESSHLTLFVLPLMPGEGVEKARGALLSFRPQAPRPFHLDLQGLNAFRKDVVYLDVKETEERRALVELAGALQRHFKAEGLEFEERPMTPHCTIAKMAKVRGFSRLLKKRFKGQEGGRGEGPTSEPENAQELRMTEDCPKMVGEGNAEGEPSRGAEGEASAPPDAEGKTGHLKHIDPRAWKDFTFPDSEGAWVSRVRIDRIQLLRMEGRRKGHYYPVEEELMLTTESEPDFTVSDL